MTETTSSLQINQPHSHHVQKVPKDEENCASSPHETITQMCCWRLFSDKNSRRNTSASTLLHRRNKNKTLEINVNLPGCTPAPPRPLKKTIPGILSRRKISKTLTVDVNLPALLPDCTPPAPRAHKKLKRGPLSRRRNRKMLWIDVDLPVSTFWTPPPTPRGSTKSKNINFGSA